MSQPAPEPKAGLLAQTLAGLQGGAPLLRAAERGLALGELVLRAARLLRERAHLRLGLG